MIKAKPGEIEKKTFQTDGQKGYAVLGMRY